MLITTAHVNICSSPIFTSVVEKLSRLEIKQCLWFIITKVPILSMLDQVLAYNNKSELKVLGGFEQCQVNKECSKKG